MMSLYCYSCHLSNIIQSCALGVLMEGKTIYWGCRRSVYAICMPFIFNTCSDFAILALNVKDEIPQGLQLIANAAGHTLMLNGQKEVRKRVLISSIFRLIVGYLFLSSLFINIAQNSDVIEIFYDVLALEFVENIDDTTFALGKCVSI